MWSISSDGDKKHGYDETVFVVMISTLSFSSGGQGVMVGVGVVCGRSDDIGE